MLVRGSQLVRPLAALTVISSCVACAMTTGCTTATRQPVRIITPGYNYTQATPDLVLHDQAPILPDQVAAVERNDLDLRQP